MDEMVDIDLQAIMSRAIAFCHLVKWSACTHIMALVAPYVAITASLATCEDSQK
jgi:hypothetical protein